MNNELLAELIKKLCQLKESKKTLTEALKETNTLIAQQETAIVDTMLDIAEAAGLEDPSAFTVDVEGRRYGVKMKSYYSIRAERREEAFRQLRALGLGDLIVEKVDNRTLTKVLGELSDADGTLPPEYQRLPLSAYQKATITDRKVSQ